MLIEVSDDFRIIPTYRYIIMNTTQEPTQAIINKVLKAIKALPDYSFLSNKDFEQQLKSECDPIIKKLLLSFYELDEYHINILLACDDYSACREKIKKDNIQNLGEKKEEVAIHWVTMAVYQQLVRR